MSSFIQGFGEITVEDSDHGGEGKEETYLPTNCWYECENE